MPSGSGWLRTLPHSGRLSKLTYRELRGYDIPSYYRLCAISKAAGMNISRRGRVRFAQSQGKGGAGEAVKRDPTQAVIFRVDASKPRRAQQTQ